MLKNLLVYRFILVNFVMFALLGVGFSQGYVQYVFQNDHSHISYVIAAIFSVLLVGCGIRSHKTATALNELKTRTNHVEKVRIHKEAQKMVIKNRFLRSGLECLTLLAIIGTVIGMVMMTSSIDTNNISLAKMLPGIGVAFMATAVGAATVFWLLIPVTMLETATDLLVKDSE